MSTLASAVCNHPSDSPCHHPYGAFSNGQSDDSLHLDISAGVLSLHIPATEGSGPAHVTLWSLADDLSNALSTSGNPLESLVPAPQPAPVVEWAFLCKLADEREPFAAYIDAPTVSDAAQALNARLFLTGATVEWVRYLRSDRLAQRESRFMRAGTAGRGRVLVAA